MSNIQPDKGTLSLNFTFVFSAGEIENLPVTFSQNRFFNDKRHVSGAIHLVGSKNQNLSDIVIAHNLVMI